LENSVENSVLGKKQEKAFDPLIIDDCVKALISGYTSKAGECRFFSEALSSKCFLDPYSRRVWNCEGKCFINGYRCEYISEVFSSKNSTEEIYFNMALIGKKGIHFISTLGWSVLSLEEASAICGIKKEEAPFILNILKLLKLVSQKDGKLVLTEKGRIIHDYLLSKIL
jgi:hypothetical protein